MSEILNFKFFCPEGKEDRTAEILESLDCVIPNSVAFNISEITGITVYETDDVTIEKGFSIIGQALPICVDQIKQLLDDEGINSKRVVFYNPDNVIDSSDDTFE